MQEELAEQAAREGVSFDYTKGSSFPGIEGKTYFTANLNGDSIDITIRVIDELGFYTFLDETKSSSCMKK